MTKFKPHLLSGVPGADGGMAPHVSFVWGSWPTPNVFVRNVLMSRKWKVNSLRTLEMNLAPLPRVVPVPRHHLEIIIDVSQKVVQTSPTFRFSKTHVESFVSCMTTVFGYHDCS